MADKPIIVVVDDTLWKSIARDAMSFMVLTGFVMLGWWVDSAPLQWLGGCFWLLFIINRVFQLHTKHQYSPEQARAEIDRIEAEAS
jgi:hypothetical protein